MNLSWIDWTVMAVVMMSLVGVAFYCRKYTSGVADYLAANRCAGRYLLTIAEGTAGLAAVLILGTLQMVYRIGYASGWWYNLGTPLSLLVMFTGWVIYRYRATRALTLAQFFEMRYSRRFRIFAGSLCFLSGIVNFGIFPAVGANCLIYFCNLPEHFSLLGISISTFAFICFWAIFIPLVMTLFGGQIAILVTEFLQGQFTNITLIAIVVVVLLKFNLSDIFLTIQTAPAAGKSMVNPFKIAEIEGFNFWYFAITMFVMVYGRMSWQGSQGFNCSARNPHEAKMAGVLAGFRGWYISVCLALLALTAYTVMHHPQYAADAARVQAGLNAINNTQVQDQMVTPIALTTFLPVGLMGAFATFIFAALIGSHNTALHSWGSIFIQDIVIPIANRHFSPRQHMLMLRLSTAGVAVFVFIFSVMFRQTQDIFMYCALTGAIWLGGSGAVIIGGLYWNRGSTAAAYAALISGAVTGFVGLTCEQVWPGIYGKAFPITGQVMSFYAICIAIILYVIVSLIGRTKCNLDKILHRGEYAISEDSGTVSQASEKVTWKSFFGVTAEFTKWDKYIYLFMTIRGLGEFAVFVVMTVTAIIVGMSDAGWSLYHRCWVTYSLVAGFIIVVWLTIGGFKDLLKMFKILRSAKRNELDDGAVPESQKAEVISESNQKPILSNNPD